MFLLPSVRTPAAPPNLARSGDVAPAPWVKHRIAVDGTLSLLLMMMIVDIFDYVHQVHVDDDDDDDDDGCCGSC